MIGSRLSEQGGGRRQLGEGAFCKHYMNFPITSWDYAAIFNIKKIKGSLARLKDGSKKVVSIGWVCMISYIHIAFDQKISHQGRSLKELTGYEWWRIVRHFSRVHEYVYGVTVRVECRQCSKAVRRL